MESKESELPFIKEIKREQKDFEGFHGSESPLAELARPVDAATMSVYALSFPQQKEIGRGRYIDDVISQSVAVDKVAAEEKEAPSSKRLRKIPNPFMIPEFDIASDHRQAESPDHTQGNRLQWEIELHCSKRKHHELFTTGNKSKTTGSKKSRKKRMDEWSSEEVIMLLQCTKLLINCELKCISRALFPFIRRSPGKCWGRAAEKKLKRMNIFGNWRQSNKGDVLKRINMKLRELGDPPVSNELVHVTDQIKMQVEPSLFPESSPKLQACSFEEISIE